MTGLSLLVLGLLAVVVFAGALVQAVIGLGIGLLLAPAVALATPELMPELPLWVALFMAVASMFGERQHVDWPALGWAVPARIPGTAVGVWLVVEFSADALGVAVGLVVLAGVVLSLRSVDLTVSRSRLVVAGVISGITGTATSIGGPPLALLFQQREPSMVRATLAVYFAVGAALSLAGLAIAGSLAWAPLWAALLMLPFVGLGIGAGMALRGRVSQQRFRAGVLGVCALSAVLLLVRSLY